MPDRRVTFKMLDKEKRRRLTTCAVYFAILLLGILIGLIPYILSYVKESKADREVLKDFINKNITNSLTQIAKLKENIKKMSMENKEQPSALASKTTRTILHKKASVIGNGNIVLVCKGKMKVVEVLLNNISAYPADVEKFEKYCQSNKTSTKDMHTCSVSMNLVMGFTLGSTEFTEIEYTCEETYNQYDS